MLGRSASPRSPAGQFEQRPGEAEGDHACEHHLGDSQRRHCSQAAFCQPGRTVRCNCYRDVNGRLNRLVGVDSGVSL